MKLIFFEAHRFERVVFDQMNSEFGFEIDYHDVRLTAKTAVLARGSQAICCFVNDKLDEACLTVLKAQGVKLIALRSAGFNHVDLSAAKKLGLMVSRVPGYSPHAVAEFAVALLLTLNRKTHKAYARVRELNFSLDGLTGFDLCGKTVGVIGTGKIGKIFAQIMTAFGCRVLAFDINPDPDLVQNSNILYVEAAEIFKSCDVISLHIPLVPETFHLINSFSIQQMKQGVLIVNTGRGGLIDAKALICGLKQGKIGGAALDVYEEEENVFFQDLSAQVLQDDTLARLLTFPNVLITSHQAFLTEEALRNIAKSTLESVREFQLKGEVSPEKKLC